VACQLLPSAAKGSRPLGNLIKVGDHGGLRVELGMPDLDEPGDVADQVYMPGGANPKTGLRAMALEPTLVDHLAEWRRIEQPA
jgi:hypothetical protein